MDVYYDTSALENLTCFDCKKNELIENSGDLVCRYCGTVNQRQILDYSPEWNNYNKDDNEDLSRVGYTDVIDTFINDKHLIKYNNKPVNIHEKKLFKICTNVLDLIENAIETSKMIFNDILSKYKELNIVIRGDNITGLMAASVFYGCKIHDTHRPISLLLNVFKISTSKFNTGCSEILELLNDKIYHKQLIKQSSSNDLIVRMIYDIDNIVDKWLVIKHCRRIIDRIKDNSIFKNQKPSKINATIIYIACNILKLKVTKNEISKILNVSIVTMVKHEKVIQDILKKC
jgi:transcription initiation factor TFIIIB Brf1 subunit/transcription initiation factor TFIIB